LDIHPLIFEARRKYSMKSKKKISKAEEPSLAYGNLDALKMVRAIRDNVSDAYWKNPESYLDDLKNSTKDFLKKFNTKKKKRRI
jgi:hypothetical protein